MGSLCFGPMSYEEGQSVDYARGYCMCLNLRVSGQYFAGLLVTQQIVAVDRGSLISMSGAVFFFSSSINPLKPNITVHHAEGNKDTSMTPKTISFRQ